MGSYFTTPETELNEKSMEDCQTPDEYADYFKRYNDENPNTYCELALKKLPNLKNKEFKGMDPFNKMHQQFSDAYQTLTDIGNYPYIIKPL